MSRARTSSPRRDLGPPFQAEIARLLDRARVPGGALAVVQGRDTVFSSGFGVCDLETGAAMSDRTPYPIASTSKAMNAAILAGLELEARLDLDATVRTYLPDFALSDPVASQTATVRDLLLMRTGLPRHDWMWIGSQLSRAELCARLAHLPLAAGFRDRFQYNNITATVAGHVAEVVSGLDWKVLAERRVFEPLAMSDTSANGGVEGMTRGYIETRERQIRPSPPRRSLTTAPSGGAIVSTVRDMAQWLKANLAAGAAGRVESPLPGLAALHQPRILAPQDQGAPSPICAYGLGWFVDVSGGRTRLSHGGYIHDVESHVLVVPSLGFAAVSFINFGAPGLSRAINERALEVLHGQAAGRTLATALREYEDKVRANLSRIDAARSAVRRAPRSGRGRYRGVFTHPAYGDLAIVESPGGLRLTKGQVSVPLAFVDERTWIVENDDQFVIHVPHPFDGAARVEFTFDGPRRQATALVFQIEPAVAPLTFLRRATEPAR